MESFVANMLVYSIIFALCAIVFAIVCFGLGQSLRVLIPLSFILFLPLYVPYWGYAAVQPKFEWADQAKQSAWFDFKKMLLFWSRLLTLRRPFLY